MVEKEYNWHLPPLSPVSPPSRGREAVGDQVAFEEDGMKDIVKFGLVPFGLALGATVAYRLSAEAMAVVVGVISAVIACTVMGGLTLVIVRATNQRAPAEPSGPAGYPPVVVIQPGAPAPLPLSQPAGWSAPAYSQPGQRSFAIVGDEDDKVTW
jgi:hypothetical protein